MFPDCPINLNKPTLVELSHGGGGKKTSELIETIFMPAFANQFLAQAHDGAIFNVDSGKMAITTDSFVVSPISFPGGSIGDLAVNGTVNDLLCCGAYPLYITCGFIIEEGFEIEKLKSIANTMSKAARKAGVLVVTGDTKVVEKGKGDGVYINTTGVGTVREGINLSPFNVRPGDKIIITGEIGNHGIAVLSKREGLEFKTEIKSDTAALTQLTHSLLRAVPNTRVLRDPTRGGLAAVLNEIAVSAGVTMNINEASIPVNKVVNAACDLLGLNPLHIANEGVMVVIVPADAKDEALKTIRESEYGSNAKIIGEVVDSSDGLVTLTLPLGQKKVLEVLSGEQLPRIC